MSARIVAGDLTATIHCIDQLFEATCPNTASATSHAAFRQDVQSVLEFCFNHDDDFSLQLCEALLPRIVRRGPQLLECSLRVREILADHYEMRDRHFDLYKILDEIPVNDAALRSSQPKFQLGLYTRMINAALAMGDPTLGESSLSKALAVRKYVKRMVGDPEAVELHRSFLAAHAALLDRNRRWVEAGLKYYELSVSIAADTGDSDAAQAGLEALQKSIICAVLGDSGPLRSRLLSSLTNDERLPSVSGDLAVLVDKLGHCHMLRPADIVYVSQLLQPHQQTRINTSSNQTCIEAAVAQHNLIAVSRYYANMSFASLAELMGTTPEETQNRVSALIVDRRLQAALDDVSGYIHFTASEVQAANENKNQEIATICHAFASLATQVQNAPELTLASS